MVGVVPFIAAAVGFAPGMLAISGAVVLIAYEGVMLWLRARRSNGRGKWRPSAGLATTLDAAALGIFFLLVYLDLSQHQQMSAWYGAFFAAGWAALVAWRFVVNTRRTRGPGADRAVRKQAGLSRAGAEHTRAAPRRFPCAFSGLYKFGARYDDPSLGRWTQQDPVGGSLGNPTSLDRYVCMEDDPVNLSDPTGRLSCGGAIAVLAGFTILTGLARAGVFVLGLEVAFGAELTASSGLLTFSSLGASLLGLLVTGDQTSVSCGNGNLF